MLVLGVALRLAVLPWTHGQDFTVWDLASRATLAGHNIYAHHPRYPGGPFAYLPGFLYVELLPRWVALHTGVSFTVLGKLPMLAADTAVAVLIARELREHGQGARAVALGAALYFLNPLVVYDSAFYGRFDSLACVLLLAAVRRLRRAERGPAVLLALGVAVKTFPAFVLPAVLRAARGRRWRTLAVLAAVLVGLTLPYLATLGALFHDVVLYNADKVPQGLTWQSWLPALSDPGTARAIGLVLLALFAVLAVVWGGRLPLDTAVPAVLVLFLLCNKIVIEQYLLWPVPWLVLALWRASRRTAVAGGFVLASCTAVGMIANESYHPWGRAPAACIVVLTVAAALYLGVVAAERRPGPTGSRAGERSAGAGPGAAPGELEEVAGAQRGVLRAGRAAAGRGVVAADRVEDGEVAQPPALGGVRAGRDVRADDVGAVADPGVRGGAGGRGRPHPSR